MSIGQTLESANMRAMIRERDEVRAQIRGSGVTVVIPCYEQAEYLRESLPSVFNQTVPPLEILVIDDGSEKHISLFVAGLTGYGVDSHPIPVHTIRVSNRGLPSARNVGLMNAHGHAFLPLDADDWLEPTYIEKTLPLLDAGADVVFTGLQEHGERTGRYVPGCGTPLDRLTVEQERMSNVLFYCALIRTQTLRDAGGYNGRMIHGYEDWDLWIDLMQRGAKLAGVDEPLFNYRTRKDSMLALTEKEWRDWNWDEMARHHGYVRPQSKPGAKLDAQTRRALAREERNALMNARRAARRQR